MVNISPIEEVDIRLESDSNLTVQNKIQKLDHLIEEHGQTTDPSRFTYNKKQNERQKKNTFNVK